MPNFGWKKGAFSKMRKGLGEKTSKKVRKRNLFLNKIVGDFQKYAVIICNSNLEKPV